MKKITQFIVFFISLTLAAQNLKQVQPPYPELFKTLPVISDDEPEWVKLMYGDHPNLYAITRAYDAYYRTHPYERNTHTQNYKHFINMLHINDLFRVREDGTIIRLKPAEYRALYRQLAQMRPQGQTRNFTGWTPMGPLEQYRVGSNGEYRDNHLNVYSIDQSLSNPNVLIAASETNILFKTNDKGDNWQIIGGQYPLHVTGDVKIDPDNENILYAAGNDDIWKSTDGGNTWTLVYNEYLLYITALAVHGDTVLAAGNRGLYRSDDGGNTWTRIISDKCWDVKFKVDDPNTVFVAAHNPSTNSTEIRKSTDGGLTFVPKTNGWWMPVGGTALQDGGARMGLTDADPDRIYVVLLGEENDTIEDNNYIGIYRSDDGGESWYMPYDGNGDGIPDNEPGGPYSQDHWCLTSFDPWFSWGGIYNQGFFDLDIEVSDTDPDKFMVGSLNLFYSANGGVSYEGLGGYFCTTGNCSQHPDIQEIEINGDDVWVASDGGVNKYTPDFVYEATKTKGMNGTNFWHVSQGWNQDVLTGGRYHNGNTAWYEEYGHGKFLAVGGGESPTGFLEKYDSKRAHYDDIHDIVIPDSLTGYPVEINNFEEYPNQSYYTDAKSEIEYHPYYWNTFFMGKDNALKVTYDNGLSFQNLYVFGTDPGDKVKDIEIAYSDPDIMYVVQDLGAEDRLWKTADGGQTWTEISLPVTTSELHISINPVNPDEFYLSTSLTSGQKVLKTTDGGQTWTDWTTATLGSDKIQAIKYVWGTDGGVYIGSYYNIYYRNNSMSDWEIINDGLLYYKRAMLFLPFYRDGKMRIATFNSGVYETDLYDTPMPVAMPMTAEASPSCPSRGIRFDHFSNINHQGAVWQWDFPGASAVSDPAARNPVVYYDSPGTYDVSLTITDAWGNSHTTTIPGMINIQADYCQVETDPMNAGAFVSATSSDLINNDMDYTGLTEFTFTGWIKPDSIQVDYAGIFSLGDGSGENKNVLNFREGNNTLGIHWNGGNYHWDSNLIVEPDKWNFVALRVSPGEIKLYVNEQTAVLNTTTNPFDVDRIIIGSYYTWYTRRYEGQMEELRFWKRALSDEEIRLQRHLIIDDLSDPDMIAYYQFNHLNTGKIFDKKNQYDLSVSSGFGLVPSTAPVAWGHSQQLTVDAAGIYDFDLAHFSIDFGNTVPGGDVVVSELWHIPVDTPSAVVPLGYDKYWVINNYGNNTGLEINSITFSNFGDIHDATLPDTRLYKRGSNDFSAADWTDLGTPVSLDTQNSIAVFDGSAIQSFSQFFVASTHTLGIDDAAAGVHLYPNPVYETFYIHTGGDGQWQIKVVNLQGQIIWEGDTEGELTRIDARNWPAGLYLVHIGNAADGKTFKLIKAERR